jgi:hypothetical protein
MRKYIYADESGNFDFSRNPKASRYFILTSVLVEDHDIASELMELKRELAWSGLSLPQGFHATEDNQIVRNEVFAVLNKYDFRIDATILDKSKTRPKLQTSNELFYQYAWYYHMKYIAPRVASQSDELMVIGASIRTKGRPTAFQDAIRDVMNQVSPTSATQTAMWPASVEPCLQVADYCCWAIQRKWERGDSRSYVLIKAKIRSEYDLFQAGGTTYY